jgi:hypothetical protein
MAAILKDLRSASSLVLLFSSKQNLWPTSHRDNNLSPSTDKIVFALKTSTISDN